MNMKAKPTMPKLCVYNHKSSLYNYQINFNFVFTHNFFVFLQKFNYEIFNSSTVPNLAMKVKPIYRTWLLHGRQRDLNNDLQLSASMAVHQSRTHRFAAWVVRHTLYLFLALQSHEMVPSISSGYSAPFIPLLYLTKMDELKNTLKAATNSTDYRPQMFFDPLCPVTTPDQCCPANLDLEFEL
jgi:hypothetical protein